MTRITPPFKSAEKAVSNNARQSHIFKKRNTVHIHFFRLILLIRAASTLTQTFENRFEVRPRNFIQKFSICVIVEVLHHDQISRFDLWQRHALIFVCNRFDACS